MTTKMFDFKIFKKTLANGLTVLVKPSRQLPRVQVDLWYRVGSKHEKTGQKGMAHLIEHMLFKGTKLLSESDMDLVAQKLASYSNAFTSQDATCYVMRLPSSSWTESFKLLAESMQHARFDEQSLASELKAVIEELRMYADDSQSGLLEAMLASVFAGHPYQTPIIGTKHDLCGLRRDDLFAFYKQHYHPNNAVLVVAGDVDPEEVFASADSLFGIIPAGDVAEQISFPYTPDIAAKTVTLYRPVTNPSLCFMYVIPGFEREMAHFFDVASLILANGKSSRLYQLLVEKEELAHDVDSFVYSFHEHGIFGISISPVSEKVIPRIKELVTKEVHNLVHGDIAEWEFQAAHKRAQVDIGSLLESIEHQAYFIGSTYLATGDVTYAQHYLQKLTEITAKELKTTLAHYLRPTVQHIGYLLPLPAAERATFNLIAAGQDELERQILHAHRRTTPIEPGNYVNTVNYPALSEFSYPKPHQKTLANGLDLLWHHHTGTKNVSLLFALKASHLYETEEQAGICGLLLRLLTQRTKHHTSKALHRLLEEHGIYLQAGVNSISIRCLAQELPRALALLTEMLMEPSFDGPTIKQLVTQSINDLDDYWDTPMDFVDQLARSLMYQDHPYAHNALGSRETLQACNAKALRQFYNTFCSPQGATLVIVGNLTGIDVVDVVQKTLGSWDGERIPDLAYPPISWPQATSVVYPLPRNQVVLGFAAPSIMRSDPHYLAAAVLDVILAGGILGSSSSRLFSLRQQSGLFYTIAGSLLYEAGLQPGMVFIKTMVSYDKVAQACALIEQTIQKLASEGVTQEEFVMAKNLLTHAPVELFETNTGIAKTFLFIKKQKLSFDLFDKQGQQLSILNIDDVQAVAKLMCDARKVSVITIGRVEGSSVPDGQLVLKDKERIVVVKKKTVKRAVKKSSAKKSTAKKTTARKTVKKAAGAVAKKRVVKKAAPKKKAVAKKAAPKKAAAKKAAPKKKAAAKRAPAKRAAAKKSTAKKAAPKRKAVKKARPARKKAVAKKAPESSIGGTQQPA